MQGAQTVEIGNVQLDPNQCQLAGPSGRVRIEPRVAELAVFLAGNAGEVVARDALIDAVWQGYPGADRSLTTAISKLRRALVDTGGDAELIETVPKRGYRLKVSVAGKKPEDSGGVKAMAVLPLRNLGTDSDDEFLCEGLAEEILNALAQVPSLRVAARASSFELARRGIPLKELGQRLDVTHVLEGSIRRVGDRLRVRIGMLDVGSETQTWSREFDQHWSDLLEMQDSITRHVLSDTFGSVGATYQNAIPRHKERSPDAFAAFLKGRYFWDRDNTNPGKAFDYFHRAIELDPGFAAPYAGLVNCYCTYGVWQLMPQDRARSRACDYAEQAMALAPESADVQFSHGYVQFYVRWRWQSAEVSMLRALEIDPEHILAHSFLGLLYAVLHRDAEAIAHADKLVDLDPLSSWCWTMRSLVYYYTRDFETAVAAAREALELDDREPFSLWLASSSLVHLQRTEEALPLIRQLETATDQIDLLYGTAAAAYAVCGMPEEAERVLSELRRRDSEEGVNPLVFSLTCAALGRHEEAVEALQAAFDERNMATFYISREPYVDSIRERPEFEAILRDLGLSQHAG